MFFIILGNGNGTFGTKVDYAAGADPRDVTIGDLNGGGGLDLAVASNSGNEQPVLIGNGNGTFAAPTLFNVGGSPLGVRILDINNDGRGDIVTANQTGNNISVLLDTDTDGQPDADVQHPGVSGRSQSHRVLPPVTSTTT